MAKHRDKADQDQGTFSGRLPKETKGAHRDKTPDTTDWSEYPPMPDPPHMKYEQE